MIDKRRYQRRARQERYWKKRCLLFFAFTVAIGARSDTGPEYLVNEKHKDPLSHAFTLVRMPYKVERENLLHLRTFYQDRTYDGAADREDWAGGGWLSAVGSYWDSSIKLAATGYTSQKLYADDDKADTGSLQPGHNGYSVLGEVYGSLTLEKLALKAGRYAINLPYVNKDDTRMTPQTFQAAHAAYQLHETWTAAAGVVTHIKARTRTGFDSLYKSAGLDGDEDLYIGGAVHQSEPGTQAGLYAMHAPEYLNGVYLELSKRFWLKEKKYIQLSGQYTRQESTGDELDGNFTVDHYGARVTWRDDWYSGSLAYTDYPEEDRLRSPWGGVPGYTSVLVNDFDRAEESAWLLGGTVDVDTLGIRGLTINAKAIFGDTPDCGATASPDQDEYNLNFNYKPPLPKLAGLLLQLRFGWVEQDDTCLGGDAVDISEVRFVTNYEFNF